MVGIIIANTGSPAAPEPDAIEAYLRAFLMDDRIRQLPKPLWKWLLNKHILPKRKFSAAKRYEFIWTAEGSPLIAGQERLAQKVQRLFDEDPSASKEPFSRYSFADSHAAELSVGNRYTPYMLFVAGENVYSAFPCSSCTCTGSLTCIFCADSSPADTASAPAATADAHSAKMAISASRFKKFKSTASVHHQV